MKILIQQLARFGDIYMTWPVIRALKRSSLERGENCEIHILVRKRFSEALEGLDEVDRVIELPTQSWAQSLINEKNSEIFEGSLGLVTEFVNSLKAEKYDRILNFSFSPLSSYLTHAVASAETQVSGYTRFQDGSFQCADPLSLYFYSQVGESRRNRYHVVDLLAAMANVDLMDIDHRAPKKDFGTSVDLDPRRTVVVHVGASHKKKTLLGFQWGRVIKSFLEQCPQFDIVLIGSSEEKFIAEEILAHTTPKHVKSFVGATRVPQVFDLLKNAHSLMACDSMALHMASLTQTPCFNLSFKTVNFWETGPLAPGSVILQLQDPTTVNTFEIATQWAAFAQGESQDDIYRVQKGIPRYQGASSAVQDFEWSLIQALYMNEPFPVTEDALFCQCIDKVNQLNELLIGHLKDIQKKPSSQLFLFLNQTENTLMTMARFHPAIDSLVRWYRGCKIQVAPGAEAEIINEYLKIHLEFRSILKIDLWSESDELSMKKE